MKREGVGGKERKGKGERETDRETDRQTDRERESMNGNSVSFVMM